ncbi:hypothetical protein JXQ70_18080 [bacterium]|nr:hypothetical protein [bacterium]
MVLINFSAKELTGKIVYYGPGLCGKTTNLQYIYKNLAPRIKGHFISLATDEDRTLFFDFLPIDLGRVRGMRTRFMLYTVPGQVFYNETRKVVMRGADAIVFVADSQVDRADANIESFENMKENLVLNGINPDTIPLVFQYNKRDVKRIVPLEELNKQLNLRNVPYFGSIATQGHGVMETFTSIGKMLMVDLKKNYHLKTKLKQTDQDEPEQKEQRPAIKEKPVEKPEIRVEEPVALTSTPAPQPHLQTQDELAELISPEDSPIVTEELSEALNTEALPVAKEEVVLHSQKLSWFSIDGDTLKREEGDSRSTPLAGLKPKQKPSQHPVQSSETKPTSIDPIKTVQPPAGEPLPPIPVQHLQNQENSLKNEVDQLRQENLELKQNQAELVRLMTELKKEIQTMHKKDS